MYKKSVLMIKSTYHGFGGHDIVINNLCLGLKKLGYKTTIGAFTFKNNPPNNIDTIQLNKFRFLGNRKNNFDIIHSHETKMNCYSFFTNKPFIFHYHGINGFIQETNLKFSLFICKGKINRIIAVSKSADKQLVRITGNHATDIIINGVDTKYFNENLPKSFKKGEPQLLFVGNLYPSKNVGVIINTMPELLKKFPNAHFQIIGSGKDFPNLEREIQIKKLEKHVELVGNIPYDKIALRHSSCDIFVSASSLEASPLPILESMACGNPVVLSDIPPHREIIDISGAGLIFSQSNNHDIIDKICNVYEKKNDYSMAANKFTKKHDWMEKCSQLADIYNQITM